MSTPPPFPGAQLAQDPQPGDRVRFKWRGAWVRGIVTNSLTPRREPLRVPLLREDGPDAGKRVYWRNRTQVYAR